MNVNLSSGSYGNHYKIQKQNQQQNIGFGINKQKLASCAIGLFVVGGGMAYGGRKTIAESSTVQNILEAPKNWLNNLFTPKMKIDSTGGRPNTGSITADDKPIVQSTLPDDKKIEQAFAMSKEVPITADVLDTKDCKVPDVRKDSEGKAKPYNWKELDGLLSPYQEKEGATMKCTLRGLMKTQALYETCFSKNKSYGPTIDGNGNIKLSCKETKPGLSEEMQELALEMSECINKGGKFSVAKNASNEITKLCRGARK
jgi:hypothetical protein